ncbi:V-type ATP synthase subunit I [Eilatimonas milleporae]|uniref:V/A-type H+-transporting ATPase subunit I n=1 Tax=Eilatimonas milleporae TaxID=911205 RepID=A0A3M0CMX2_9PROT|nr:V-type ATP synthase subunit I [Eilatimonas milleporae]RMB04593.1 V/A-type H+-transporting ATPase subunit I [Eilatimonas milleporae]
MTIVPLKKVTLCGHFPEKKAILEGLQALGCMHLLPLRITPVEIEKVVSPHADAAYKALRFLAAVPDKRRQVMRAPDFDVDRFVAEVAALRQALRDASDRRDFLKHRIAAIEPWGDILFPPRQTLAGYRLWFYILPLRKLAALKTVDYPWQIVGKSHRAAYVVLVSEMEPPDDVLPVPRTHTGALPLSELCRQLEEVEIEIEDLRAQRQALTRYIHLLSANLAEAENHASLASAEQQTYDSDALVTLQGWVPEGSVDDVRAYAEKMQLACLIEDPGAQETPPTLLDQPDDMQAGVDLAMFYQVPGYRGWDPTRLLIPSFSIFFAMILADGGYGLVLLAGLLMFWRRLGRGAKGGAYRLLGLMMAGCSVLYGVLIGSYFGVGPPEGSVLDRLSVLRIDDFDTMMRVSIVCGVLHIGIANAMNAYANRRRPVALAGLGWIGVLAGGMVLWLAAPDSARHTAGLGLIVSGLLLVFFFSSERVVRKPLDYVLRAVDGLMSLTGLMGAFGDVLSYMRLFALGLAGASLAITFNDLAKGVHESLPGVGVLAAFLILAAGHLLNLGLSIVSGVVHGLRLNFIEFYKWGLPEEGKAFRKFARKEPEL